MRFAREFWLWLVPLLPLLWVLLRTADGRARDRLAILLGPRASEHVERANPRLVGWQRFFLFCCLFWLLLALARPQWGASEVTVTQQGSDIVVALDISNSMLAEDVPPTRMERAKAELATFLDRLEDSRVGLVFFAGSAFVQCPLTLDYGTAGIFLKMAGPDMLSAQGTAIGSALDTSRELLAKGREGAPGGTFQAILLVTDGEDLEGDWETAVKACLDDGIRVIPVGVGEETGGLIPVTDARGRPAGFMKDPEGNVVTTRLDLASLEEMASMGGGSAFRIGVDGLAGDRLFAELERLGRRDLEERRVSAYQERYIIPLLLAMACLALRLLLFARKGTADRQGNSRGVAAGAGLLVLLGALALPTTAPAGVIPAGRSDLAEGRRHFLEGDFENALGSFEEAQSEAPDDPVISLARGSALFRLERFEDAAQEFSRAGDLADDPELQAQALYNGGTAHLAGGQLDKAIEQLRESIRVGGPREDALFNLEVALKRLEEQQQQQEQQEKQEQQQPQDQEEQQENQEQQQENQDQQQPGQDQKPDQPDEKQQDQQQGQDEEPPQDHPQQEPSPGEQETPEESEVQPGEEELTEAQAEQILKALDRDEEELKRSVQKRLRGGQPKSGKKW